MKIGIITPYYPYRGGVAQFSQLLIAELKKNHDVQIYSYSTLYPQFLFPGKSQFVENKPDIELEKTARLVNTTSPLSFFKTAKEINKFAPDILLMVYWFPYQAPALGTIARLINKSIWKVGLVHNALPHESSILSKMLGSYFMSACNSFIALSNYVKKDIISLAGEKKSVLVLDHPVFDHYKNSDRSTINKNKIAYGLNDNKKTLLFFGLIREYKGLDLLLEAMSLLDDSYQLLVIGECYEDFNKYQRIIDASPAKKRISINAKYIADDEVSNYFSVSDLLVLPYKSATQSGVLATAIQMNTPIVGTPVGELGNAIKKSGIGLVASDVSAKAIADAIKLFFQTSVDYSYAFSVERDRLSFASFSQNMIDVIKKYIENS